MAHRLFASLLAAAALVAPAAASAGAVFLKDGRVIVVSPADSSGSDQVYDSFGAKLEIDSSSVLKTDADLSALSSGSYDVVLSDDTVLSGRIVGCDPDSGLVVDLPIGKISVPLSGVKLIVDPAQQRRWEGSAFSARATAYYCSVIRSGSFGPSFAAGLSLDARLPVRGLSVGVAAEWSPLSYEDSTQVSYSLISAVPRLGYRYLGLRSSSGILSALTPFAYLGAGLAYIGIEDAREGAAEASYGGLALCAAAELGLDAQLGKEVSARLSGRPELVMQSGAPFVSIGIGLSATWEIDR